MDQKNKLRFGLKLSYRLGKPIAEQVNPYNVRELRTLQGGRYDLIDRNNDIVLRYQKSVSSPSQAKLVIDAPDKVTIYAVRPISVGASKDETDNKTDENKKYQEEYIHKVLQHFNMKGGKSLSTPMDASLKLGKNDWPKSDVEKENMAKVPYSSAIGSLMHAMVSTRPKIAYM